MKQVSYDSTANFLTFCINRSLFYFKARLFDGLDDENEYSGETFVPRRSVKKLVLNSKSQVCIHWSDNAFVCRFPGQFLKSDWRQYRIGQR